MTPDRDAVMPATVLATVLATVIEPAWLPAGSRAEVVAGGAPTDPVGFVRLLLRRGDHVFCVPRAETGTLDLPTRPVGPASAALVAADLARDVTGATTALRFVGAVRNVVPHPTADYPWPAPVAHFGVWAVDAAPRVAGEWIDARVPGSPLRERHWFPLLRMDATGSVQT